MPRQNAPPRDGLPRPGRAVLYTAPGCVHCRRAKAFLKRLGIGFGELDLAKSPKARKALDRLGARSLPVLMVGERRVDGFDERRYRAVLGIGPAEPAAR